MKKISIWLLGISFAIFVITWGIIGIKILDNNYEFTTEAYIAYSSLAVFFICLIYERCTYRCPHCNRINQVFGKYCPYCGKEIN